jgi:hypothetical protein
LITTGSFTREAQAEATRDGAPPVELIDGDRLCDLLKEFRLGVEVRERIEQDVTVNPWLLRRVRMNRRACREDAAADLHVLVVQIVRQLSKRQTADRAREMHSARR